MPPEELEGRIVTFDIVPFAWRMHIARGLLIESDMIFIAIS